MQLVMGRDAILNVKHEANWEYIRQRKQRMIHLNNLRENRKRREYTYHVGQQVLVKNDWTKSKYGEDPWKGPFEILKVNDNGTVRLRMGAVIDTVNLRQIKPFNS